MKFSKKRASMFVVLLVTALTGILSVVSGQTNLITVSELDSAKGDYPKFVAATTNIVIAVQFGEAIIPKNAKLSVLLVSRGKVTALYNGLTNEIPATSTDIIEQINTLRSHRLIVNKEQYDDCRIEPYNSVAVKVFHRAGIATIQMEILPPELQKKYGFDPKMAEDFRAAQAEANKIAEAEQERAKLAKQVFADPLRVGAVGGLDRDVHIVQITGSSEMLAEITVGCYSGYQNFSNADVERLHISLVDAVRPGPGGWNVPIRSKRKELFYIKGLPTEGFVDGENFAVKSIFKITGTKRYTTAIGGSKTVFVLEPFE